jgi:hypothetical protein
MLAGLILLHQRQTKNKMKTTTITLAVIFTLFTNVLLAGNDYLNTNAAPAANNYSIECFVPVFPTVATFEDAIITTDLSGLYPMVPSEASFEDAETNGISVAGLAPVIPSVADFE